MSVTRSLQFLATPWSVAIALALVAATAVLAFIAWRRSGFNRSVGLLELLRLALVALVALLLNQPEWVEEYRPEQRPTIAVLHDDSGSMDTRDATRSDTPTGGVTTRREAIGPLLNPEAWAKLRDRVNVAIEPIATPQPGHGTDLYDPLAQATDKFPNLRAIVVASDGDWNEGQPPVQAAASLRTKGIPIFAIPVGSRTRLPDLELINFDVPTFGIAGKSVRIPFTIDSALPREYVTTVTLKTSDGEELTREVRVAPMSRTSDAIVWKPKTTGDSTLTLTVPKQADEFSAENNTLTAPIAIRDETLKVLIVESFPRWEYRYLRNALSRDPGVELSCLLFHPELGKVGGGNKDYIKEFPAGLDELGKYDVVFLGDVGLDSGQLTPEQCRLIRGLVEFQASGLVFMPGAQGRQFSLLETPLTDLYPVVLDPSQQSGWGSRTAEHFELTETGRRSLLTKLADTSDDNAEVWEGLPGFQWYAPVLRAKAGTEVLAVHKETANETGRLPLLVTRTFGTGKVLFMGTDGAWRWRKGVEDKYHYRFWGQVVRWMAYQRNMAKGESMRLYYTPDQPRMNQTIALNANVMDKSGEPLRQGDVTVRIVAPSGQADTVRLSSDGEEWGMFTGSYRATEAGRHAVTLASRQTGATLETSLFVQGVSAEPIGRPARPEVLEELARVTKGRSLEPSKLEEIVQALAALPEPAPSVRRVQLWSHPVVMGGLVALMGAFWVGRKVVGLI